MNENQHAELYQALADKKHELRSAITAWSNATGNGILPWAKEISAERLFNCRVLPNRHHGLDVMVKGGRCAEVGTARGEFARDIIDRTSPSEIHIIDLSLSAFDRSLFTEDELNSKIHFHEGYSDIMLEKMPQSYFDWIYIDASHSYENFIKDLRISATKVRPGGKIICNDYTNWSPGEVENYGVMQGVNEFCQDEDWEFVYLALHGQGYHDVCLRRR